MFDPVYIRKDFPSIHQFYEGKNLVYFDSAASALKPQAMVDRLSQYYAFEASNVHRGAHFLSDRATGYYEDARQTVADFIGAGEDGDIIFTSGTTDSINLVAHSFSQLLNSGDEILISKMEHHSNIVPWHLVAERLDLKIQYIDLHEDGRLNWESFIDKLSSKTKLVALTMVSNVTGVINPVKEVIQKAHEVGAKVLLDGAQAVSSFEVNVQKIDCDFLAFSGHKIYGPNGIGVLYGKSELLNKMPPYRGGGSMIKEVTEEGSTFLSAPFRFEAGTPNVGGAIGLAAAVKYFSSYDRHEIHQHKKFLLSTLENKLSDMPEIKLFTHGEQDRIGVCSFEVKGVHHSDISTLLDQEGYAVRSGHHCAQLLMKHFGSSGTLRASFDIYNTVDEIDGFVVALKKAIGFFK
ncbi:MAG: cysteine desulfurase [Bdellovibrionales bacterium]|nr:cysteine desulfurase [Bdellovibrionales bacterium]